MKIVTVVAGDKNFIHYTTTSAEYSKKLGYPTKIYDLGGSGIGKPFEARVSPQVGAKIPSKPNIIKDALLDADVNDVVVWIDADALILDRIDEILDVNFDIGVTVRQPKAKENSLPINAGIVFVRKTDRALKFVDNWIELCKTGVSDQQELNRICQVTTKDIDTSVNRDNTLIHVFQCRIYNNSYFKKKPAPHAKILHYKSKLRHLFPL